LSSVAAKFQGIQSPGISATRWWWRWSATRWSNGQQVLDASGRVRADPDEHVGEVVDGVDAGEAAGLGERVDHGDGAAAAHAAGEQSVPAVVWRST
jgi:hypothetical protein